MSRRVFISGGSGFVGSAVIDQLCSRGYGVNALVNRNELPANNRDIKSFTGGLFDAAAVQSAMAGCVAAVHLVGIIMEEPSRGITFESIHHQGTRAVVDAAIQQGVGRYVQMSALGTRADAISEYHKTKWKAEEVVRAGTLDWTIIRPSMIHGPAGEFMQMEAKWAKKQVMPFLFMPYFGRGLLGLGGAGLLQPVYVQDVARAFADALENPKTIRQVYDLGGAERLTWPQLHETAARLIVGHKRWVMPIPAWYARLLATLLPAWLLPFNSDQVIMSQEDNTCNLAHFTGDFGWSPRSFSDALGEYATALGS